MPPSPLKNKFPKRALVILLFVCVWVIMPFLGYGLNRKLGRRTGEVDRGSWYVLRASDGSTYLEKGINRDNQFLDADRAEQLISATPDYVRTLEGYGAAWIQHGWFKDGSLYGGGWHVFRSENEAVRYLQEQGVEKEAIYFHYK